MVRRRVNKDNKRVFLSLATCAKDNEKVVKRYDVYDCSSIGDIRDVPDVTSMYMKSRPSYYGYKNLSYLKDMAVLRKVACQLKDWYDLGVLELLTHVTKENHANHITCFIPFFLKGSRKLRFPKCVVDERLISDMTLNGVNSHVYSIHTEMQLVLHHVKNWNSDTIFYCADLSKAYLKVKIPSDLQKYFGVYLPDFDGNPFGKEVFGCLKGCPFGYKAGSFLLKHYTDFMMRIILLDFPKLLAHIWVDDFLLYCNMKFEFDRVSFSKRLQCRFVEIVGSVGHDVNLKKSDFTGKRVFVHNGIEFNLDIGVIKLPDEKYDRVVKILDFVSFASLKELEIVSIKEFECYSGVLSYVGYMFNFMRCYLTPWYKFSSERGTRPNLLYLVKESKKLLNIIKKFFPCGIHRKLFVKPNGYYTLWDVKFDDADLDEDVLIISVDSSQVETGIFIPKQKGINENVFKSIDISDKGGSCKNELFGILLAIKDVVGLNQRVLILNDNVGSVVHLNLLRSVDELMNDEIGSLLHKFVVDNLGVVGRWAPGVLMHYADNASRSICNHSTAFYKDSCPINFNEIYLLNAHDISDCVYVWEGFLDIFKLLLPEYHDTSLKCLIKVLKKDENKRIVYDGYIKGSFHIFNRV